MPEPELASTVSDDGAPIEPPPTMPRWQVWLIVAGFPAVYWLNSFTPWSIGLFVEGDRSWRSAFFASVVVLHWASVAAVVLVLWKNGQRLRQIGFEMQIPGVLAFFGTLIAVGLALLMLRQLWPAHEGPLEPSMAFYPATFSEKLAWIGVSITAGFCEELVYRGAAIRDLRGRGLKTWQAVAIASASFSLMHGPTGVILFPLFFAFALLFSALFLWTKRLAPAMYLHALFDVMAVLAV
jgi:membrane protease YdiL (CAAX protease family)